MTARASGREPQATSPAPSRRARHAPRGVAAPLEAVPLEAAPLEAADGPGGAQGTARGAQLLSIPNTFECISVDFVRISYGFCMDLFEHHEDF